MKKGSIVIYIGDTYKVSLTKGNIYEVLDERYGWIQLIDDTSELYYFPSDEFILVV